MRWMRGEKLEIKNYAVARCSYCGKPSEGNFSIHRDGFNVGPEVPLCDACGMNEVPSCEDIWQKTSWLVN